MRPKSAPAGDATAAGEVQEGRQHWALCRRDDLYYPAEQSVRPRWLDAAIVWVLREGEPMAASTIAAVLGVTEDGRPGFAYEVVVRGLRRGYADGWLTLVAREGEPELVGLPAPYLTMEAFMAELDAAREAEGRRYFLNQVEG